jgi:hypothetical protein
VYRVEKQLGLCATRCITVMFFRIYFVKQMRFCGSRRRVAGYQDVTHASADMAEQLPTTSPTRAALRPSLPHIRSSSWGRERLATLAERNACGSAAVQPGTSG